MSFGGTGGTGKVRSEINVTPLVDVVLVMLIIFLVAMPIVMRKIEVDVPKKIPDDTPDVVPPDQTTIEVTAGGRVLLNGIEINRTELAVKLHDKLESKREKIVFVDFDNSIRYGDAVSIMDTAKGAGGKVALKMKDENGAAAPPGTPGVPVQPPAAPPPSAPSQ